MDEWTLNDLLECSVCLERLDTSSKVLPCQHTFCRPCLDEIITRQKELRCPECRVVVHASVDDLPPNVLLMRILEGIKNSGDKIHSGEKKKASSNSQKQEEASNSTEQTASQNDDNKDQKPAVVPTVPYAIAMYDYTSREAGDLHFSKGSIIFLLRKVDEHWYQGEFNGSIGIFPLNYVQVMRPLPPQQPACKALYDFRMPNDDDEGCLAFKKNDVISVIRKVDENWGEGKLNDRIGIFPLAFVEMNQAAECLMQNFRNPPPSESSRNLPPTPNPETCVPEAVSSSVNNRNNIAKLSKVPMNGFVGKVEGRPVSPVPSKLTNFLTLSSSSSATGTSSSSSTSNSAPNSPPSCQPPNSSNPFLPQSPRLRMLQSLLSKPTHGVLPTSHIADSQPSTGRQEVVNNPQSGDLSALSQPKGKRHSFSSPSSTSQNDSNRHQGEKVEKGNEGLESSNVNGRVSRPGSQRHRRSESDYVVTTGDPDKYIALYSYKPQKADELELQKGNMYYVLEVCQDGWFKGTSVKTQQTGVFPGNYVALVKKLPIILPPPTQPSPPPCHPRSSSSQTKPTKNQILQAQAMQLHYQLLDELENQSLQMMPPELPPRVSSPSSRQRSSFLSPAWNAKLEQNLASLRSSLFAELSSTGYTSEAQSQRSGVAIVAPCTTSGVSSNTSAKSTEATKDKKEKSGGLIKRLTTIKRSKSPPASSSSYSMDNPVFDESPALGLMSFRSHLAAQAQQSLHSRSGSCPSQLIHVPEAGTNHRILSASVSARMKHKERPSVSSASFTHSTSRDSDPIGAVYPTQSSHRKSNSLDAEESRKPKQLVPPIRERFRCIVPYPPNSDYELELRVGDIIYVHKKRDDGWYKGTQQRTGRTGLFPGSFVESY